MIATFDWTSPRVHLGSLLLAVAIGLWYLEATRAGATPASKGQRWAFFSGLLIFLIAMSWPVADLAHSTSLAVLVVQRLLLVLGAAPLLMLGIPDLLAARLTSPAPIDWLVVHLARPGIAIITTTALLAVTGVPPTVAWSCHNQVVASVMGLLMLVAGLVLFQPVLDKVPGLPRLSPLGKVGYLMAQSVAPTFLSFAWIISGRPLYGAFSGQSKVLHLSALADQQLAGYIAKLGTFSVLWTIAYVLFSRMPSDESSEQSPLRWSDVERSLARAERRGQTIRESGPEKNNSQNLE